MKWYEDEKTITILIYGWTFKTLQCTVSPMHSHKNLKLVFYKATKATYCNLFTLLSGLTQVKHSLTGTNGTFYSVYLTESRWFQQFMSYTTHLKWIIPKKSLYFLSRSTAEMLNTHAWQDVGCVKQAGFVQSETVWIESLFLLHREYHNVI